ncbi:MAG: hypothetical protein D6767_10610 [Candidatus Hydrogenedentota bacterium]|nr:MAG: hypothetical protein D6767_10610 [Candidatus Hydrogenedentota bacterium]
MAIVDFSVKRRLDEAIVADTPVRIRAYAVISPTEEALNYVLENVLTKYDRSELIAPAYTIVKEMAINGAKANIKRILFAENNINIHDMAEYDRGMEIFRKNMNEDWMKQYAMKAREMNLYVDIVLDFNPHRLILEVINNCPISHKEHDRIREKFKKAIHYDNIAEFYLDGGDHEEGAGMGIVLITMLLKAQNLDPHLFTIHSDYVSKTIARVELPITDEYVSRRHRYLQEA